MPTPIDNNRRAELTSSARVDAAHLRPGLSAAEFLEIESKHLVPILNEIADLFYFSALGLGVSADLFNAKSLESFYEDNAVVLKKRFIDNEALVPEEITSLYMSATIKAANIVDQVAEKIPGFGIKRDDLQRYLAILIVSVQVESLRTGEILLDPKVLESRFQGELVELHQEIGDLQQKSPNFKAQTGLKSLERIFRLALQGRFQFQSIFQILNILAKRTVHQDPKRSLHADLAYGLKKIMNNSLQKSLARNTAILGNTNEGYAEMKARLKRPEELRTLMDLSAIDVAL